MMDRIVVNTAVSRKDCAEPFFGTVMTILTRKRTRSNHAMADAKLNPATMALRDCARNSLDASTKVVPICCIVGVGAGAAAFFIL